MGKRPIVGLLAVALVLVIGVGSASANPLGIARPFHGTRAAAPAVHAGATTLRASGAVHGTGVPCPAGCAPPLLYGGGPVMHSVTTHVIAWAPAGYQFPTDGYVSGYEQYLNDVAGDLGGTTSVSSVAAQYVDASGSALSSLGNAAVIYDTNQYPASGCTLVPGASECLTEQQIISEIQAQIGSTLPVNLGQSYIVLLPDQVDTCDNSGGECADNVFCGYHDSFTIGSSTTTFTLLPYTEASYQPSGFCTPQYAPPGTTATDLAALESVGAHELLESATDPLGTGYIDPHNNEIADECAWTFDPVSIAPGGGYYNQVVHGNPYLIQDMWSNQDAACVQGDSGPVTATVSASGTPGAPTSLGVTMSGATAISYEWSYLDPNGSLHSDASASPAPSLNLPAGTNTVWVQVTDTAGGTIFGVKSITVVPPPPPTAAFAVPTSVMAGTNVTFTSNATAGVGSITTDVWSFGDGNAETGSSVLHSYATPGNYTVTLTVTQTDGLTASVQHTVTVTPSLASIRTFLLGGLRPPGSLTSMAALLHRHGATTSVTVPGQPGTLAITWYTKVKRHKVVVARGVGAISGQTSATHIMVKLTKAGRALVRRGKRFKVSIVGVFRFGSSSTTVTRTLTLR